MRHALLLTVLLLLVSCAPKEPAPPAPPEPPEVQGPRFVRVDNVGPVVRSLMPHRQGLASFEGLRPALERSLAYVKARPAGNAAAHSAGLLLTWSQLRATLEDLLAALPELDADPGLLEERFVWFRLDPGTLLTGYYEPLIRASKTRSAEYFYPLYGVPDDMKTLELGRFHPRWKGQRLLYRMEDGKAVPYFDREAIDGEGALAGQGLEIAWLADPVDAFFLHIQGSGRLVYPDGSMEHVLYAGKNGHQYRSLGRILIDDGRVPKDEMSMKRIRRFLAEHPEERDAYLYQNPSYVFFRLHDEGPYGSIGRTLTPFVSMAVDPKTIPLGALLALDTGLPDGDGTEPFTGVMLAQDTGGAIKGTRCDLFCGFGHKAKYLAGHLQHDASVYLLVSRRVLRQ
ncbi:murein transglycosylase A [Salidesulfovibrio brasiliensis]|uniref:murein transglycosylase A n=1 Tax=Salidesulfovibrio brasiliensis TaxID=221711 RepID=UPI0006D0AF9E|nr:MltA domain-containing protein [Salidesulfovibrio brasiliensis]